RSDAGVAQRGERGRGYLGKPRPVGAVGSGLEPEILGAPEHLRCADLVRSQPVAELPAISCNTLEAQQRHEGFEPRIGWSRAVGCSAHLRSPGLRHVQACGCASNGGWLDGGSAIGVEAWPSPAVTKLDAMCWPSRARPAACEPSLAVEVPPVLLLLTAATDWPLTTVTDWPLMES